MEGASCQTKNKAKQTGKGCKTGVGDLKRAGENGSAGRCVGKLLGSELLQKLGQAKAAVASQATSPGSACDLLGGPRRPQAMSVGGPTTLRNSRLNSTFMWAKSAW